jgi:hypothetical protein
MEQISDVERLQRKSTGAEDLTDFVAAVIEVETGEPAIIRDAVRLPLPWMLWADGLPGFDSGNRLLRFTRDPEIWRDSAGRDTGFFGSAHPLVLHAIRRGCRLPGAVAVSRADHLGLLQTFEMEIPVAHRIMFREIIAVIARPDHPPIESSRWLALGVPEHTAPREALWDRLFAPWVEVARLETEAFAAQIASRRHHTFVARYEALRQHDTARSRRWLRVRADLLCGPFVTPTGDLFGGSDPGPIWRSQEDPATRLISLATGHDIPASKRREANEALETFQAIEPSNAMPGPFVCRQIGLLMLVPRDAP